MKGGALGARFRRQVPIGPWIVDFASLAPRLVVEVDDPSHEYRDESYRTDYLTDVGFVVLRFTNRDVALEADAALRTIAHWIEVIRSTGRPPE